MKRILFVMVVAALALAASACGDGDGGGGAGMTVDVVLSEFAIVPSVSSETAGQVTFAINNDGQEMHEFVVIKSDLALEELPTDENGALSEEGAGMEVIDEVEDITAGSDETLTVTLDAGSYFLVCNIVEEEGGEVESHFQLGMHRPFQVE